jgi:chorismate mutase
MKSKDELKPFSFMEYLLIGTEVRDSTVRRYTSPEEHPFFPDYLPPPMLDLPRLLYPDDLLSSINEASEVNMNPELLKRYVSQVIPSICEDGDDEQHGSSVLCDVAVLQALSKRIHYGKFVAESKYRASPEGYRKLVAEGDKEGVWNLLTNKRVEEMVLRRAAMKCATYGREPLLNDVMLPLKGGVGSGKGSSESDNLDVLATVVSAAAAAAAVAAVQSLRGSKDGEMGGGSWEGKGGLKVNPSAIEGIYRNIIIPLTKEVEVEYLFRRCSERGCKDFKLT